MWKFPLVVMKGVVEYDRLEREKKSKVAKTGDSEFENDEAVAVVELRAYEGGPHPTVSVTHNIGITQGEDDSAEYEEVEVTDDEDNCNPSKRQKFGDNALTEPVEFNEDDIAYQLAAMDHHYGLNPDKYEGQQDQGLEEGKGPVLTDEDAKTLFKDMLDDYKITPYTTWDKIIEAGQIVEDERYTILQTMKSRKESWHEWSREKIQRLKEQREREEMNDPRIPYFSFLQSHATPKLYWPEFRRKYKNEAALRNGKLSDKEREKSYREYISRKLSMYFFKCLR